MNNICIGIVSWLPDKEPDRQQRIDRLVRLIKQLDTIFPNIPIIFIAQNWRTFRISSPKRIVKTFFYDKLGIVKARAELREQFLKSKYDNLIMFDDDAIIEELEKDGGLKYLTCIEQHPNSFCFLQYEASQLSGCCISKYIYEKEPIVDVCPEKNEAYEDTIWSHLLKYKYSENEFKCNTIKCIHFNNRNEIAPSTWADEDENRNWPQLTKNTYFLIDYIKEHKDIPNLRAYFDHNIIIDRNMSYEEYKRIMDRAHVDNIVSKLPESAKQILKDALEEAYNLK